MNPERTVVLVMRTLALTFATVGLIFLITPDGTIHRLDQLGDAIGSFHDGPRTDEKFWLGLAFAYMTVITGIAWLVSTDVVRFRPVLLVLAAGKAASSLTSLGFFLFSHDVFIYFANFVVDGSLVVVSLVCWSLAGRIERPG